MFASAVRLLAKRRALRNCERPGIDPRLPLDEAERLALALHSILNTYGPLTTADCWNKAQLTPGFASKRHMKILLRWMKERNLVKTKSNKYHLLELDKEERFPNTKDID